MPGMYDLNRWRDRVALVTGASSGIGRAIATYLAGAGMRVAACARRRDRLEALRAEHGDRVLALEVDVRDEDRVRAAWAEVGATWGGIDVLVNNAGLGHKAPLVSGDTAMWREMLEVNVLALCVCTREAVADLRRRGAEGHIIHVSSMSAHRVPPGSGMYSATKFAVRSLTEGLRTELRELGLPIRVTAISPGFVETEFAEKYHRSAAAAEQTYGRYKVLEPGDVAKAVAYALAQPAHVQVHDLLMRPTEQGS
jgi:17beta-estradiol 17-dehydrogenase / 3beta-hydroxysteroid 3-dehydrogenase